jgi:hypothetical protein
MTSIMQRVNESTSIPIAHREPRKRPRTRKPTTTTMSTATTTNTAKRVVASSILIVASTFPLACQAWTTASRSIHTKPYETLSSAPSVVVDYPLFSLSDLRMSASGDLKMSLSSLDLKMKQQPQAPTMFLSDRFFPAATLSASPATERNRHSAAEENSSHDQRRQQQLYLQQNRSRKRRGVLGFDVFELEAHSQKSHGSSSSSTSTSPSQVDLKSWSRQENFFPNSHNSFAAPFAATSTTVSASSLRSSSLAWLPWIPTKSQILSLKLTELKEACGQRRLVKVRKQKRKKET